MRFPLDLRFKLIAVAPQITVTDATGAVVLYVRQRAFRLREAVTVFGDAAATEPRYRMAADRVLDFRARYRIEDARGAPLGVVQRRGMRSLWRAHYEVHRDGVAVMTIREENPWIKLVDGLAGQVPFLMFLTGYFLHPTYLVRRVHSDTPVLRVLKRPALLESHYTLAQDQPQEPEEERLAVLAVLMTVLLERGRG